MDFAGGDGEVEGVAGLHIGAAGQAGQQGIAAGGEAGVDHRIGAERFDQFDLDRDVADALAGFMRQVLGADAQRDFAAGAGSTVAAAPLESGTLWPPRSSTPSAVRTAGRKFMAGEPMKPATKVLAGRW